MVLLIDANIILDVLCDRTEFIKDSSLVWKMCEVGQAKGYISTLTYANLMCIMRKQLSPTQMEDIYHRLELIFEFAPFNNSILENAVKMCWSDFEDAVQSATASSIHADYIITRNIKDFKQSKIMALTPAEFLSRV